MTSGSSREARWWRSIRWAAYGCLALALLQVLALPWPFGHPELGPFALPSWIGQLSFSLLGALALFNRQLWAAVMLGAYGIGRLYFVVASLVHLLDGSAVTSGLGPGVYVALMIPLPFAVLWIRGAVAAIRLWRLPQMRSEQAG